MACVDCMWWTGAIVFISYLAAADSTLCSSNALDNSCCLQPSDYICHNILLHER